MSRLTKWEQFQAAYQSADERTRKLIDSNVIPDCIDKKLPDEADGELRQDLVVFLGYRLLNISDYAALQSHLQGLGLPQESVTHFVSAVNDCLTEISTTPTPEAKEEIAAEIAKTEAALSSIQKVRTMEGDMQAAENEPVVRAAGQDELLQKRPQVADTPEYATEEPRWESDKQQ